MNLEPAANPAEAESTVVDTAQQEANTPAVGETETKEGETEEPDELDALAGISKDEPEPVEVEYEGKTFKVDPEIKDALLRQADYSRKTMEVAEARKAFEAEREQFQLTANQTKEEFQATVALVKLSEQAQQYEQVDWQAWMQSDPQGAQAARWEYDKIIRDRDQVNQALSIYLQNKARTQTEEIEVARRQAIEQVSKEIPNFTDARRTELESLVENLGAPKGTSAKLSDAWEYKILHFADIGRKFVERQREAAKAARAVKPATMVGGSAAAGTKNPDDMTVQEWNAWRSKALAKK